MAAGEGGWTSCGTGCTRWRRRSNTAFPSLCPPGSRTIGNKRREERYLSYNNQVETGFCINVFIYNQSVGFVSQKKGSINLNRQGQRMIRVKRESYIHLPFFGILTCVTSDVSNLQFIHPCNCRAVQEDERVGELSCPKCGRDFRNTTLLTRHVNDCLDRDF